MGKKRPRQRKHTLLNPGHDVDPNDSMGFLELTSFTEGWKDLGLNDDDLEALQRMIVLQPNGYPVVAGTGKLRKMRFAPARWKTGKRGAVRVGYVYLAARGIVLLVIAYGKEEKDDLSPAEKKAIRQLIDRVEAEFDSGTIR